MIDRLCKNPYCGSKALKGDYCFNHKPRSPMKQTSTLKAKKPMNKVGKIGKKLSAQTQAFKRQLKPPYLCIYCQYLGIDYPLELEFVNVEHTQSKARHPALRFVEDNLAVSCPGHNEMKKSLDIEDFLAILDKQKEIN